MKSCLIFFLVTATLLADPTVSILEWKPACDGASIEIIAEGPKILSLRAWATHSAIIVEWHLHYVDGVPITAEFREFIRGRIAEGDRAGEYSGINRLKRIATYRREKDGFQIADTTLGQELADIFVKAGAQNR